MCIRDSLLHLTIQAPTQSAGYGRSTLHAGRFPVSTTIPIRVFRVWCALSLTIVADECKLEIVHVLFLLRDCYPVRSQQVRLGRQPRHEIAFDSAHVDIWQRHLRVFVRHLEFQPHALAVPTFTAHLDAVTHCVDCLTDIHLMLHYVSPSVCVTHGCSFISSVIVSPTSVSGNTCSCRTFSFLAS